MIDNRPSTICDSLRHIILCIIIFCTSAAYAEDTDSLLLMGWPRDAFTMQPVIDSTRVELMTLDSTVIAVAEPFWDSVYRPNSKFIIPVGFRSGEYIVRLTNPQYQTTVKRFKIKVFKQDFAYTIGDIKMRRRPVSQTKELSEVTVTATKIKFYNKGDTIVYNADAFNLAEGSMLDALVEQLPGVELKRDGRIFLNGKRVESVLLNGKDFFRGDNTILLDNLPAYTVKDIKFYDKKSERSEGLGVDLNDGRFVMDVNLKREYQIGWLANAEGGGGTHKRWLGRLFALRFTPQSRLSFYVNANNTHESRKPGRNGEWSPSAIGNGTSTTEASGFEYLVHDKMHRYEIEGNVNFTHTDNDAVMKQNREIFQSDGSVFGRVLRTGSSHSTSVSTNHNFRFMLGPENDRYQTQLYLKPQFSYNYLKNNADRMSAEFSDNPIGDGNLENLFDGPGASRELTDILVNKVRTRQQGNSESIGGGVDAKLYFKLPLGGRRMELTADFHAGKSRYHSFDLYSLTYADSREEDRRSRYYDQPSDNIRGNIGLAWAHILLSKGFHRISLSPSIGYGYSHSRQENSLYRLDWLEEMDNAGFATLPSTRDALLSTLDRHNSYLSTNNSHTTRASVSFSYSHDKREQRKNDNVRTALWRLTLTPAVELKAEGLDFDGQQLIGNSRTALLPSMMMRLERNTPGMMHQMWLEGSYRQQLPSMFSLMGLSFDSDPLNISEGNTDLRRTEIFSTELWYTSDQWGREKQRRLSGKLTLTFYHNSVATAQIYDAETGVRTFRPENVNGNYDIRFNTNFSTSIDAKQRFTLNIGLSNDFYRNTDLQATNSPIVKSSTVFTNYMTVPLSVEYNYKKMRLGTKFQIAWHNAMSERENFQSVNGVNLDVGIYGNIRLPWDIQLATDFSYYTRLGYANSVMNTDNFVWNAQLSKSILHGSLIFALVGYDILGDISNLNYSVNMQGVTETWRNVIPRYGMLRVIYKLNKQPNKKL